MTAPVALVTGIAGQDGSYLAELLLGKGYVVHGIVRRSSSIRSTWRLDHLYQDPQVKDRRLILHYGDVTDLGSVIGVLQEAQPHEVYNLAAQSHVAVSFEVPGATAAATALGALNVLEAVQLTGMVKRVRLFQASSSEMFGNALPPQGEGTPFAPRSPYAISKVFAHEMTVHYREAYGLHASCGISFNHESERRSETFVTRKVARAAAAIAAGRQGCLYLGNLDAERDWGHARDYVEAFWLMLQQDDPGDYVLATGEAHSVRDLVDLAFERVSMPLRWLQDSLRGWVAKTEGGKEVVRTNHRYYRGVAEVDHLCGNAAKARKVLGWEPRTDFVALVHEMVDAEVEALECSG